MNLDAKTVNQLSRLNKTAKLGVLIAVFICILIGGYFLDTSDQLTTLEEAQLKEETLKATFLDKKKQAVNLAAYKQQKADIESAFGTLLKQLPNKSEMDALLNDVNQAGIGRGLAFELFRPVAKENIFDFYAEQPVSVRVSGTFHEFGLFAEDISKLPRIVNLDDVAITVVGGAAAPVNPRAPLAGSAGPARLTLEATARTYRYLDPSEIQAAKRKGAPK